MKRKASEATTRRLSLYLRVLAAFEEQGRRMASSGDIAGACQINPSQVRKDLAHFGGFGVRGVGYEVARLRDVIAAILGLHRGSRVAIVGAGNLGSALADYTGFAGGGFEIVALFDVSPAKIGRRTRGGAPVHHVDGLEQVIAERAVEIGIIAVPAEAAQEAVTRLVGAGVRAILNFAPVRPTVPDGIVIRHVDLKVELESLSYVLAEQADK